MSSEAHKIISKQCGTVVCYIGFYLEMGKNWSPWSEFCCLLYWFHCVQSTEMKLQKHSYDDNSMGFLSTEILYRTLLCQMCFKYSLLHVASATASIQNHKQTNTCTELLVTHIPIIIFGKKNIESMLYETWERREDFLIFTLVWQMCFCEREWSSAGQVISLSQWESSPWNSPREAKKAAFIIFLLYDCQNLLYFTFCSWRPFFHFYISVPLILSPTCLDIGVFGVCMCFQMIENWLSC